VPQVLAPCEGAMWCTTVVIIIIIIIIVIIIIIIIIIINTIITRHAQLQPRTEVPHNGLGTM
jgi:uncharacterized membrane protein YdbT with pleckstrin-like domain